MIRRFGVALRKSEEGATVIEFALIASLIAVALGSTIMALGASVESHYDTVETKYSDSNR